MNLVEPTIPLALTPLLGVVLLATCFCLALRSAYRLWVFRMIDREGYHTPELQEFHLQERARERGKVFTQTRTQGCGAQHGYSQRVASAGYF